MSKRLILFGGVDARPCRSSPSAMSASWDAEGVGSLPALASPPGKNIPVGVAGPISPGCGPEALREVAYDIFERGADESVEGRVEVLAAATTEWATDEDAPLEFSDVSLAPLRHVLESPRYIQDEFLRLVFTGRLKDAQQLLEASAGHRTSCPHIGYALHRLVRECPVADVRVDSFIVNGPMGEESLIRAAASEIEFNPALGACVSAACVLALGDRLHGRLLSTRIFGSRVGPPRPLPPLVPEDSVRPEAHWPVWVTVFASDNRHFTAGHSLAASVTTFARSLAGVAYAEPAAVQCLYKYGDAMAASGGSDRVKESVLELEEALLLPHHMNKDGGTAHKDTNALKTLWAHAVATFLLPLNETELGGLEVHNTQHNLRVEVAPCCGYFFLFAWSKEVHAVAYNALLGVVSSTDEAPQVFDGVLPCPVPSSAGYPPSPRTPVDTGEAFLFLLSPLASVMACVVQRRKREQQTRMHRGWWCGV